MKKLFILLLFAMFITTIARSQEIKLPPPVENEFFNKCEGKWISEPYEFMGMKWTDETTFSWILNKQFMEMRVTTKSAGGDFSFNSYGIMGVDKDGKYKSFGFDEWGWADISISDGKITGNKLISSGKSDFMKFSGTMVARNAFCIPSVSPIKSPYKPKRSQTA